MQAPPNYPPEYQQKKNNNVLLIVLGALAVCGCGGVVVLAAVLFPVFSQARLAATKAQALSNMKQSSLALVMYTADYDDRLPVAAHWTDLVLPYTKNEDVFKAAYFKHKDPKAYGVAFRKSLSRKETALISDLNAWAMVFDSTILSRNAASELDTLPSPERYGSGSRAANMIGFLDGHAKATPNSYLSAVGPNGKPTIR